jgi:hypothetical protein
LRSAQVDHREARNPTFWLHCERQPLRIDYDNMVHAKRAYITFSSLLASRLEQGIAGYPELILRDFAGSFFSTQSY